MPSFMDEWRNANAHRQFPLDDGASGESASPAGFRVPQSLMVDLRLDVPHDADPGEFAVTRIVVAGASATVYVSYMESTPFVIGSFTLVPGIFGNEVQMDGAATDDQSWRGLSGVMASGFLDEALKFPGDWTFTPGSANINPACVRNGPAGVRALVVDDEALYGSVVLRAGDNIDIARTWDAVNGRHVLTFSAASPAGSLVINNDQDLLDALVARFGEPVRTINGIPPDEDGEFKILGADCVDVSPGAGSVTISNPCATPCCDQEEYLGALYEALNDLNARYARLLQFEEALTESVNMMQNKIGTLHMGLQRN